MPSDVGPSIEERLTAALTEVARSVSIEQPPAWIVDDEVTRPRGWRTVALASIAAILVVAVAIALTVRARTTAGNSRHPATASTSTPNARFVDDGPLDAPRTYRGGLITLLPPTGHVPAALTALAAYQAYTANNTYPWRHTPPKPHLVLAKTTIYDYGATHKDGTVTPFLDHRLTWVVTFTHVPYASVGNPGGKPLGPATTPAPGPTPSRPSNLTVLVFVDASTGKVLDAQGQNASTGPPAPPLKCPSRAPEGVAPHQFPVTTPYFVPSTPGALLVCRYHGLNQPQPEATLASSAQFAPGPIAAALNAQTAIPRGVVFNCPADFGETIVLIFVYDDLRLTISVGTSGCRFATNGDRTIHMDPATLTRLEAVLGRDTTP